MNHAAVDHHNFPQSYRERHVGHAEKTFPSLLDDVEGHRANDHCASDSNVQATARFARCCGAAYDSYTGRSEIIQSVPERSM